MQKTWRQMLGTILENPLERRRIASELDISQVTLMRWVSGDSTPRIQNLHNLLSALPQHHDLLLSLIEDDLPGFSAERQDMITPTGSITTIPAEFYIRVMRTRSVTPKNLQFSSLCQMILEQALKQLDPYRLGLVIIIASCMPPSVGQKVRSLREQEGVGTPPWGQPQLGTILLGAESLTGHAIVSGRLETNQELDDILGLSPGYRGQWEASAAAAPIMHAGNIAGALLVSSAKPNYFVPPVCSLLEDLAELLALAFAPEDFYEPQRIQLEVMPPADAQQTYLREFGQRLVDTMIRASQQGQPMTYAQAEQVVLKQIEEALLHWSSRNG